LEDPAAALFRVWPNFALRAHAGATSADPFLRGPRWRANCV